MILDDHDVALRELWIEPAAGIADDQVFAAERLHDTHGQGDLCRRIALVMMESSLHRDHGLAGQFAANEPARMAWSGRDGEMRNVTVGKGRLGGDFLDEPSEAGAEDDASDRLTLPLRADGLSRFLDLVVEIGHAHFP